MSDSKTKSMNQMNSSSDIEVAELFYSLQGEGRYSGVPAVFCRLSECNLSCGVSHEDLPDRSAPQEEYESNQSDESTWVCDTLSTWRSEGDNYTPQELYEEFETRGFIEAFRNGAHLVITGGEPMLPGNQDAITSFLSTLLPRTAGSYYTGYPDVVEVETNGTITPTADVDMYIDQYNVSLKLSNSGMDEERRITEEAIRAFNSKVHDDDATYKFVVSDEDDISEIETLLEEHNIPEDGIMLMPAGATREQLNETRTMVAECARDNAWRYCDRIQLTAWDEATGV